TVIGVQVVGEVGDGEQAGDVHEADLVASPGALGDQPGNLDVVGVDPALHHGGQDRRDRGDVEGHVRHGPQDGVQQGAEPGGRAGDVGVAVEVIGADVQQHHG